MEDYETPIENGFINAMELILNTIENLIGHDDDTFKEFIKAWPTLSNFLLLFFEEIGYRKEPGHQDTILSNQSKVVQILAFFISTKEFSDEFVSLPESLNDNIMIKKMSKAIVDYVKR